MDSANLYKTLTEQVIPTFFDRDAQGIPRKWIQMIRRAMVTLVPQFTTRRMVKEYTEKYYADASERGTRQCRFRREQVKARRRRDQARSQRDEADFLCNVLRFLVGFCNIPWIVRAESSCGIFG